MKGKEGQLQTVTMILTSPAICNNVNNCQYMDLFLYKKNNLSKHSQSYYLLLKMFLTDNTLKAEGITATLQVFLFKEQGTTVRNLSKGIRYKCYWKKK